MLEKLNRRIIAGIFNGEIRLKEELNQVELVVHSHLDQPLLVALEHVPSFRE